MPREKNERGLNPSIAPPIGGDLKLKNIGKGSLTKMPMFPSLIDARTPLTKEERTNKKGIISWKCFSLSQVKLELSSKLICPSRKKHTQNKMLPLTK